MMKSSYLWICLLLILGFVACKQDNTSENVATTNDTTYGNADTKKPKEAGTLACTVDGQIWNATKIASIYSERGNSIMPTINATYRTDSTNTVMTLRLVNMDGEGEYKLDSKNIKGRYTVAFFREWIKGQKGVIAYKGVEGSGEVTITKYDKENQSVSGSFSFDGQVGKTDKKISITDGKFEDIQLEKMEVKEPTPEQKEFARKKHEEARKKLEEQKKANR